MDRRLVALILFIACAVRLAAGCWWQQQLPPGKRFGFPDSEAYWHLAQTLVRGQPFQMNPDRRVFRTPGYPATLASLFLLVGDDPPVVWARALNALLGTLAVGGVMGLAYSLFDRRAALLAGLAAAVCPESIATGVFVLSEAPFCPLLLLQLVLGTWAWKSRAAPQAAGWATVSGVAAGLATLLRPSWLLFTPFALAVAWFVRPGRTQPPACPFPGGRRYTLVSLCMLLGLVTAMSPWWIRNWRVTGSFVPTTLQVGESLYDGWNPHANGGSDMRFVDEFRQQLRTEDAQRGATSEELATFESRLDRRMWDAALAWAQGQPRRVAELAVVKFLRIWNVWPNEPGLQSPLVRVAVLCGYAPVLVFSVIGAWKFAGRGWPYLLCGLPAVYFTALHMVFVGSLRYRQPALLPLIVLAAGAAWELVVRGGLRSPAPVEDSPRPGIPGSEAGGEGVSSAFGLSPCLHA
ncbi:MAG: glycosyltransferase family 39 protein [Planctomycetota bacterium]|nr:glycosyltransferase family 39 protein [Planctomycetota bacterium]